MTASITSWTGSKISRTSVKVEKTKLFPPVLLRVQERIAQQALIQLITRHSRYTSNSLSAVAETSSTRCFRAEIG